MAKQSETDSNLYLLDSLEDYQSKILDLLEQGKYTVKIFSRELNHLLFDSTQVVEAVSAIARRSPASDVRLLITQPQSLVDQNHKLLTLARRLPSKIKIQKLTIDTTDNKAFMIVDDNKVWLQHDEEVIAGENTGFVNINAKAEAKQLSQEFSELWRYSEDDVRLRKLTI